MYCSTGASGTAPVGCADRSAAGADAFVSLCRCESVWSRRHFSGTVVYSAVYRRTAADFLQKLRLFNSHQVLQLRETPLCTGADRAVIQNNLAGAAIQRADMRSVYQAGFVTEKKALVEFGERFIQGAAALVDRSRRMDGDAVRTGRFDIKNFMDWYE